MKLILLFLIAFSVHAKDETEIRLYKDGKPTVYADFGEDVTVESFRAKMAKAGIDVTAPGYSLVTGNRTQRIKALRDSRKAEAKGVKRQKVLDLMIEDFIKRKNIDVGAL